MTIIQSDVVCSLLYTNPPPKSEVKVEIYVSQQPAICGKERNTQFTVKRQIVLPPISNSKISRNALPSFRLGNCKHGFFFNIHTQETLNTRLEMIQHKGSAQNPMPLHKETLQ